LLLPTIGLAQSISVSRIDEQAVKVPKWSYQKRQGLADPPAVGRLSSVMETYAPIQEPDAAKPTYTQFFV
jgi:hypothetical protein